MKLEQLFCTEILNIPGSPEFLAGLEQIKSDILSIKNEGILGDEGKSVRNGWRLNNPHKHEKLVLMKNYLDFIFVNIIKFHKLPTEIDYGMTTWLNLHESGGFNTLHSHGDALFSGVLYLSAPEGSGALKFRDPRPGAMFMRRPDSSVQSQQYRNHQKIFPPVIAVKEPREGLCIVFPGWLEHYVEPSEAHSQDNPRISVAFNFSPQWK